MLEEKEVVTKAKKGGKEKSRVTINKLKLDKETTKELIGSQQKRIKGGAPPSREGLIKCN